MDQNPNSSKANPPQNGLPTGYYTTRNKKILDFCIGFVCGCVLLFVMITLLTNFGAIGALGGVFVALLGIPVPCIILFQIKRKSIAIGLMAPVLLLLLIPLWVLGGCFMMSI